MPQQQAIYHPSQKIRAGSGGRNVRPGDNVKMEFQKTMMNLKNNIIEEEEDLLDFQNGPI
jgi:hypothetical protein